VAIYTGKNISYFYYEYEYTLVKISLSLPSLLCNRKRLGCSIADRRVRAMTSIVSFTSNLLFYSNQIFLAALSLKF
jgi:hypothetical protein